MVKYHSGKFVPKHPEKYVGDVNAIVFRSGWERKFFIWCDSNPRILHWNSEEAVIPYVSEIDNRVHKYYMDAVIEYELKDGSIERSLIEIKPFSQTQPPVKGKNMNTYLYAVEQYTKNISKWKYAQEYCNKNNMKFQIITERELALQ